MTDVTQDGPAHSDAGEAADRADRIARPGRRHFVAFVTGGCASAATLAFALAGRRGARFATQYAFGIAGAWAADSSASAPATSDASVAALPAQTGYDAFIALSQHLTGRTHFDAVLGQRIYAALAHASSQFEQNVGALNTWIKAHGGVPSDTVTAALKTDQPELASTVGDIMRAWYLGLVGEMPNVQVVAYEKALMFDPVSDVLTIPSYCRDVPFYWTKKPADMPATTVAALLAAK
ncbi:sugar dehydrogenase complex small subunit [Paraburkholderia sp. J63]|uniref:sugar dehydrogenase complex small subunit n=1 Tax=Paraburkholderia sp. J63 TaxID=2805434 RepID=UPI002ABDC3B2|nr:sugar dehydrogenase complex small subunit [Paraburkholderia sp. J63]